MTTAEFREHCLAYRLKARYNTSVATTEFLNVCKIFYASTNTLRT